MNEQLQLRQRPIRQPAPAPRPVETGPAPESARGVQPARDATVTAATRHLADRADAPLAATRDGTTRFSERLAGHPLEPHVRAHEAVHALQHRHWLEGTPAGSVEQLELDAEAGAESIAAGGDYVPRFGAPSGLTLHYDPPVTSAEGDLPPEVCDPDLWLPEGESSGGIDTGYSTEMPPEEDWGVPAAGPEDNPTFDPSLVDVRSLTNADLIAEAAETRRTIASFNETSTETEAWQQHQSDIDEEKRRRIGIGFVFLGETSEQTPAHLVQLQPGAQPGVTAIMVADEADAMGRADVTLTGPIMSAGQIQAYLESAGLMQVGGEQAETAISIIQSGRLEELEREFQVARGETAGGEEGTEYSLQAMDPFYGSPMAGVSSLYRTGLRNQAAMYDPRLYPPTGNLNLAAGRMAEIQMQFDPLTQFGTRYGDFNALEYINSAGSRARGNFPEFDVGTTNAPFWQRGAEMNRYVSVAAGSEDYAFQKLTRLFASYDRFQPPSATPEAGLAHLREITGRPGLQQSDPELARLQQRYLQQSLLAVPDAMVADLRSTLRAPDTGQGSEGTRTIARQHYRQIYENTLSNSPIEVSRPDGTTITIHSLAEFAQRAPSLLRDPNAPSGPQNRARNPLQVFREDALPWMQGTDRLSRSEYETAMQELGRRAAARVVPESSANALRLSADLLRGVGAGGSTASATEVWQAPRATADQTALIRRFRQALTGEGARAGETGLARVTNPAPTEEAAARRSMVRHFAGDQGIELGSPEFHAINDAVIMQSMLAIPTGQAEPVLERARRVLSEGPSNADDLAFQVELTGFLGRNPDVSVDQLLGGAVVEHGMTPGQVEGSRRYLTLLTTDPRYRDNPNAHFNDAALTIFQHPYYERTPEGGCRINWEGVNARAGRSARGNAAASALGMGTSLLLDQLHGVERPEMSGMDYALALGRDVGVGVAQDEIAMQGGRLVARIPIEKAMVRGVVGRRLVPGVVAVATAPVMEYFAIPEGASAEEYEERLGRATFIGATSTGAAIATEAVVTPVATAGAAYIIGEFTAGGAAAGAPAGGVGAVPGAIIGFIVGAVVAGVVAYELDRNLSGGAQEWDERRAREERERRQREAEERRRRPIMTLSAGQIPLPVGLSPNITPEEQIAIASWFIAQAQEAQMAEARTHYDPDEMVCDPYFIAELSSSSGGNTD